MEEKELAKSEKSPIIKRILIIGLCVLAVGIILQTCVGNFYALQLSGAYLLGYYFVPFLYYQEGVTFPCVFTYVGLILSIYGLIFLLANRNVSLTVTDKRVFGTAKWGKRIDLPLDMISAVSTAKFGGIAVSTSSGAIQFSGIKNNAELHKTISDLLMERQGKEKPVATTTIKQEIQQSNADELEKFKNLLDKGVITQEEFDAKKKQLLGL